MTSGRPALANAAGFSCIVNTILAAVLVPLLATSVTCASISGIVTDESGQPIPAARIDHIGVLVINAPGAPNSEPPHMTDSAGRFQITTKVPAIVIRKPGYESRRLLIKGDEEVRIVLGPIRPASCKMSPPPRWRKKQANDVDFTGAWFIVKTKEGKQGIMTGSGSSYSWGVPNDRDIRESVEYYEVMYPDSVIDARGHTADGKYWRSKTIFCAAAQYYNVDAAVAQALDCVMDTLQLPKP